MGVIIAPQSELGKELARWNLPRNQFVTDPDTGEKLKGADGQPIRGMNCVGIEPYPRMLYKAQVLPNGQVSVGEVPPHPAYCSSPYEYEQKSAFADQFNRTCQRIVHSEHDERIAIGQGWSKSMPEALELHEQQQKEFARLAAEAAFYAKRMSPKAQAEFEAASDSTDKHVVDVQPTKRGRKPKPVAPMDPAVGEE